RGPPPTRRRPRRRARAPSRARAARRSPAGPARPSLRPRSSLPLERLPGSYPHRELGSAGAAAMELREITVEGRPVRYRVAGSGEPLVLVHGLAGSWRWWSPLFDALTERHRVHVLDLPRPRHTSGLVEMSVWLSRWLDAAGLDRADIVGHSLGGLLAAELAARQPARVGRLAL